MRFYAFLEHANIKNDKIVEKFSKFSTKIKSLILTSLKDLQSAGLDLSLSLTMDPEFFYAFKMISLKNFEFMRINYSRPSNADPSKIISVIHSIEDSINKIQKNKIKSDIKSDRDCIVAYLLVKPSK